MPSKSRNTRGKPAHKSRKSKAKERHGALTPGTEPPASAFARDEKMKSRTVEPVPPPARTKIMVYPHITEELKRIGILAGIIFVILIILAIVIP